MRLISIFTFLMSSMVMYRSNSDHNVVVVTFGFVLSVI